MPGASSFLGRICSGLPDLGESHLFSKFCLSSAKNNCNQHTNTRLYEWSVNWARYSHTETQINIHIHNFEMDLQNISISTQHRTPVHLTDDYWQYSAEMCCLFSWPWWKEQFTAVDPITHTHTLRHSSECHLPSLSDWKMRSKLWDIMQRKNYY